MTRQEGWLRWALIAGAVLFAVEAAIYVPEVFGGSADTRPYAVNSVAKDVLFCALTAAAAADLRRRYRLVAFVIGGHVVILTLLLLALVTGNTDFSFPPPRWLRHLIPALDPSPEARLVSWIVGCFVATVVLAWLYHRALKWRFDLRYLWPAEHATLAAVADVVLTSPRIPPDEIATAVDHYWAGLDIGYKGRLRLALWLVCLLPVVRWLRPPLPVMERGARKRFIERHFLRDIETRSSLGPFRTAVQSAIRFAMQMAYVGYYGDPRSYPGTGYQRFSERSSYPGPAPPRPRLQTVSPPRSADVVVVGSGAGGAVAAHVLASAGREVLVVERGHHVDPSEFTEDEQSQYARLYSDGALQLSRDFSFQVLQGMCVGGSTVVNNGVCFEIPPDVLDTWESMGASLDRSRLAASFEAVRKLIGAAETGEVAPNPIVHRVGDAPFRPVTANLSECYGCGYCNIGCAFGKKLSMLDSVLPSTQRETQRLDVLPDCEVTEILHRNGHATGIRGRLRPSGERVEIRANAVVVAAGTIHSSRLLMASGLGGEHVGKGLCANLGSHLTADWPDEDGPLRAFEGLQMSHYLGHSGPHAPEHMIETWFNPLMSQALVMPGWLEDHEHNMSRYDHLGCLGVLVASTPNGNSVRKRRDLFSGAEIDFTPSRDDLRRLLAGLRHAGEILFDGGASRVMPATFRYRELKSAADLGRLELDDLVKDASDISVNTGHPQGGNAIGAVVDDQLRVDGFENLLVCDASVFPTAVRVNPQLTVMALAHHSASEFTRRSPGANAAAYAAS